MLGSPTTATLNDTQLTRLQREQVGRVPGIYIGCRP